jgi:ribosome-associated heat shock protein Hsp15
MRLDKFIWTVRLAKTRSLGAKLIEAGSVKVNGTIIKKSSRTILPGQIFEVRHTPIWRKYKVIDYPKSRVGAKLVGEYITEITSEEDLELLKNVQLENKFAREVGVYGRPTKKNLRDLNKFKGLS